MIFIINADECLLVVNPRTIFMLVTLHLLMIGILYFRDNFNNESINFCKNEILCQRVAKRTVKVQLVTSPH